MYIYGPSPRISDLFNPLPQLSGIGIRNDHNKIKLIHCTDDDIMMFLPLEGESQKGLRVLVAHIFNQCS